MIDDRESRGGPPKGDSVEKQEAEANGVVEMAVGEHLSYPRSRKIPASKPVA